jgi:hypothetical protein
MSTTRAVPNVDFRLMKLDRICHSNFMKRKVGIIRNPNNHELLAGVLGICSLDEVDGK